MSLYRDEGVVLRTQKLGEADRIITLLTRQHGRLRAVAWRVEDSELGRRLLTEGGAVHVAGRLKADDWQGREGVQFEIEDAADLRRLG